MVEMDTLCHQLTLYCHDFDPKVSVVKAKPHATRGGDAAGYYHIMRFNENAPLSFTVIEAKDGGFLVPDSSMIDRLRRTDLWNERVVRDQRAVLERQEREKQAREDAEREERVEEIAERWASATETRVSFNRDTPWTQTAGAKRDR
jgi:hypothetical protein